MSCFMSQGSAFRDTIRHAESSFSALDVASSENVSNRIVFLTASLQLKLLGENKINL